MNFDRWIQGFLKVRSWYKKIKSFRSDLKRVHKAAGSPKKVDMMRSQRVTKILQAMRKNVALLQKSARQRPLVPPSQCQELCGRAFAAGLGGKNHERAFFEFGISVIERTSMLRHLMERSGEALRQIGEQRQSVQTMRRYVQKVAPIFLEMAKIPTPGSGTGKQAEFVQLNHDMIVMNGLCTDMMRALDQTSKTVRQFQQRVKEAQKRHRTYETTFKKMTSQAQLKKIKRKVAV